MKTGIVFRVISVIVLAVLPVSQLIGSLAEAQAPGPKDQVSPAEILQSLKRLEEELAAIQRSVRREFYLSKEPYPAIEALRACEPGYHFASYFEIYDVSNLKYNDELGLEAADSGDGPPATGSGWVRTGYSRVLEP